MPNIRALTCILFIAANFFSYLSFANGYEKKIYTNDLDLSAEFIPCSGLAADEYPCINDNKACIPYSQGLEPIPWTTLNLSSAAAWTDRFPLPPMNWTRQAGKVSPVAFSDWDINNLDKYKVNLKKIIGPIPKNCIPLSTIVDATNIHLTEEQMAKASIVPIMQDVKGHKTLMGYRMYPDASIFGTSPSTNASARVLYITYNDVIRQRIAAYLLVPEDEYGNIMPGPLPGVIAVHQTLYVCGKREQINACPDGSLPWNSFGQELVRRGMVVIVPDMPDYGEQYDDTAEEGLEYNSKTIRNILKYYPSVSELGIEISYIDRTISALTHNGIVHINKLGIVGHSKGGTVALLAKIYFKNLVVAFSNASAFHMFRQDDLFGSIFKSGMSGSVARWCGWAYIQNFCLYMGHLENIPIEVHHMYALAVKNGAFFSYQIQDDGLPPNISKYWESIDFINHEVSRVAPMLHGEYGYLVKRSGSLDPYPEDKACFANAGSDIPAILACLSYWGYNHGVYPKDINQFLDRTEAILKS